MNWKATTVVTGTTTLAGWLMNSWLWTATPQTDAAPQRRTTRELPDIAREADRLHRGLTTITPYEQPRRNPFRFSVRPVAPSPSPSPAPVAEVLPAPLEPAPAPITLAAIAVELVDGLTRRTAVLSTPRGIMFVKEGDIVDGYRVRVIDDEGAELVSVADESVRRMTIR